MRHWVFACIMAGAVTLLPGAVVAVTYDEAVDGDLDANTSVIAFDIGQNTITGSTSAALTLFGGEIDLDGFLITLPTGARIVSGSFTVENYDITLFNVSPFFPVTFEIFDTQLFNPVPPLGFVQYYDTENPNFEFLTATGPVTRAIVETQAPGEGRPLIAFINVGSLGGGDNFSLDYQVTLDVVPAIPLPAGGVLLLSAFAGIAFVRRKIS
ncbi:MAG: VPLPA-CTERM sorting domain-containing protein [Pseudomonadota bacterium]